jgi:imidazolonepropionase
MTATATHTLWRNARLATLDGIGWGLIDDGAMLTQGEHIVWTGRHTELPAERARLPHEVQDLHGMLVTPGLIDCHTHLVYAGQRAAEFELRLQGASYETIARAGGGIRSTVASTREASEQQLYDLALQRARVLMSEGVTTLEIKSGYGLSQASEARCLRVARRLGAELPLTVRTTFLGAHAVPPEFAGRDDAYIDEVCVWMPALQQEGLLDAVDAFCERIAFSTEQIARVFTAARALGLPVKLHAEQLSNSGGAALAASFGALSCDHLEYLDDEGIAAMRAAGSVAVLLPGAYYFLRESQRPPIAALRAAGVPMAIATDHNPGSSPGLSLLLSVNMACTLFDLTPLEAVQGVTSNAARALGFRDRGVLTAGQRADFAVWELDHPNELAYWFGGLRTRRVVVGGVERST